MRAADTIIAAFFMCGTIIAQDISGAPTPRPNRVAWMEIFPEPLPEGHDNLTLEATSQFLRPDRATSGDGRTHAILDGEEWQLTADLATPLLGGYLNMRFRVVARSGGIADQAFTSYHDALSIPQGGRNLVPKYQFHYRLERDGVVVVDLKKSDTVLLEPDIAWVKPFGTKDLGGRFGISVQLPTGKRDNFTGTGSTDGLVGGALWKRSGRWHGFTQAERVFFGLPKDSPFKAVTTQRSFTRAWVGGGYQGEGDGFFGGLGVELSLGYIENPYHVDLARMDKDGMQQYWTVTHKRLPHWRFGISEEAGSYFAPDLTIFASYRF
ncbi:MAG: DUF3187 family protein [Holophagaceae bacterium]|nr:DUF3187 family protein [Holophagaceae bacterium]